MNYGIYFDESNKLDQPNGDYSYYGALGATQPVIEEIINKTQNINKKLKTKNELHFVNYTSDADFEKYFRVLNFVIEKDIQINMMIVNKADAKQIAEKMSNSMSELRKLFYVKIPERLFYGMTRDLKDGCCVQVIIDENSEYKKLALETKLAEQMNAHSAYRNKGYKVDNVRQAPSNESIPLQIIDVLMGIVVFLLECQYENSNNKQSITKKVKSDLIYRLLIHNNNLAKLHEKVFLYKWEGQYEEIHGVNLSEYTGNFLINKTQFDLQEMNRLAKIILNTPDMDTRFYREEMGYTNQQLKTIQGYLAEINKKGRNSYYLSEI